MSGDREDDDAPRWELPDVSTDDLRRWEPEPDVPRWQPSRPASPDARPAAPGPRPAAPGPRPAAPGVRRAPAPSPRRPVPAAPVLREPPRRVSPVALPFVWWGAHPWVVLWVLVVLSPSSVLLLRVLDESDLAAAVTPAAWTMAALVLVALTLALVVSARRSLLRPVLGAAGALGTLALLLWPVTNVTLGRAACPRRAGPELGARVATGALQAWQGGVDGDAGWHRGRVDGDWQQRTRAARLADYQLVETGCWERLGPIDATRTWHEFRVVVESPGQRLLSKVVVVHTVVGAEGWEMTGIEGPLP